MIRRMTSTTDTNDFVKWDIWVAKVWYDDHSGWKIRPVMILDGSRCLVLSVGITSHSPRENYEGEYLIIDWKEAGLDHQSTLRLGDLLNIKKDNFRQRIGRLSDRDINNVLEMMRSSYSKR